MKTTPELNSIKSSILASGARLFQRESSTPKYDAQRNLSGRTNYVDDDTLRWHKSRVLSAEILADGLLYRITESVALDMNNTKRGTRCVVFDVFGTTVYHPDLENTFTSSARAEKACKNTEIDLASHYRQQLASKLHWLESDASKMRSALAMLAPSPEQATA